VSWELPDPLRDEDVAGDLDVVEWAFADSLLALGELGHREVADRLIGRWPEVDVEVLRQAGLEAGGER
jgi:hypothetical protein